MNDADDHQSQHKNEAFYDFSSCQFVNFIIYLFSSRRIFRPIVMRFAANVSEASKMPPIERMTTAAVEFQTIIEQIRITKRPTNFP